MRSWLLYCVGSVFAACAMAGIAYSIRAALLLSDLTTGERVALVMCLALATVFILAERWRASAKVRW